MLVAHVNAATTFENRANGVAAGAAARSDGRAAVFPLRARNLVTRACPVGTRVGLVAGVGGLTLLFGRGGAP
jgi:hypothetical protein